MKYSGNKSKYFLLMIMVMLMIISTGISAQSSGDVNNNGTIDIVDALLVSQYYVGLNPDNFHSIEADVDCNGLVNIVDALLIAQYYVGLIQDFPCASSTPVYTIEPTPAPTGNGNIYSFTGTLPNGLVNGEPVLYTTTASFDGSSVIVTFDGGYGFEWVWLYTPEHINMVNSSGNLWSISLSGYSEGQILEYYFTIRKNSCEANNASAPHIWVIGSESSVTPDPGLTPTPAYVLTPVPSPVHTEEPTPDPALTASPDGWNLVWSDEFTDRIGPDWVFETGNGSGGWGNNELEYYRRENAAIESGQLVITARLESYSGLNYTSVRMKTQGRKAWTYGKIEARIKLPSFTGSWPAFWTLGENITSVDWPACGEIDIMEHINTNPETHGVIHWKPDNIDYYSWGGQINTPVTEYHVYSIEWDESLIKWFVDGVKFHDADISNNINGTEEFHADHFIIINMAIGGNWPGFTVDNSAFPAKMYVDYVRVYQK